MHGFEKGVFIGAGIASIIWLGFIVSIKKDYQNQSIKHHCAQYNSQTSKFEWLK